MQRFLLPEVDMNSMNSRELVRELLSRLAIEGVQTDAAESLLQELRSALLASGSETEDNLRAVGKIGLVVRRDAQVLGVQGANAALVDIVNAMEDLPVPAAIQAQFPGLDQGAWEAAFRLITLILLSFAPGK
jgi:hypothetical protein